MQQTLSRSLKILQLVREVLIGEVERIDSHISAISQAMQKEPAKASKGDPKAGAPSKRAAKGSRRSWFEPAEVQGLLRKGARKPIRQADLVRELARMKGYADTLKGADAKKFQSAAFMAVSSGLKAKVLKRSRDGMVVAAKA